MANQGTPVVVFGAAGKGQIVLGDKLGKESCRKTSPRCPQCPLRELLPPGGPLGNDE